MKFVLRALPHQSRENCMRAIREAEDGTMVSLSEAKRSDEQNAKLHAMLGDIAKQKLWHGERLQLVEWKRLFCAAVFREKMLPGIGGGVVIVPKFTRSMSKSDVAELIEFIYAWGAENGIVWSEPEAAMPDWA
jgi:hypothetical protein